MNNFDFSKATRLDLEIWDTQNKIKYIKLPTRKPRKNELILSQTKGVELTQIEVILTLSLLQFCKPYFIH